MTSPMTKIEMGDTCESCTWLIQGAKNEEGLYCWGCKFYHTHVGFSKKPPIRLIHCDIDGRITQGRYLKRKKSNEDAIKEAQDAIGIPKSRADNDLQS